MKRLFCILIAILVLAASGCSMLSPKEEITITFSGNCPDAGEIPPPCTILQGDPVPGQPAPYRTDYFFEGWCTDPEGTQPFDFHQKVNESLTLYASWLPVGDPGSIPTDEELAAVQAACSDFSAIPVDGRQDAEIIDDAEKIAERLYKDGTIRYFSRSDQEIYLEFSCGLAYLYRIPGDPLDAAFGFRNNIISVEPDGTQRRKNGTDDMITPTTNMLKQSLPGSVSHANDMAMHINNMNDLEELEEKDFSSTSIFLWDGHGDYLPSCDQFVLLTGIRMDPDSLTYDIKNLYYDQNVNGDYIIEDLDGQNNDLILALRPHYWQKFRVMDNGLVFLAACDSMHPECEREVHNTLVKNDGIVFGSTATIKTRYVQEMMKNILSYMSGAVDGTYYTASEALEKAHQVYETIFQSNEHQTIHGSYCRTSFYTQNTVGADGKEEITIISQPAEVKYIGNDDYMLVPSVELNLVPNQEEAGSEEMLHMRLVFNADVIDEHTELGPSLEPGNENKLEYLADIPASGSTTLRISEIPSNMLDNVLLKIYCNNHLVHTQYLDLPQKRLLRLGDIPFTPVSDPPILSNAIPIGGELYYWNHPAENFISDIVVRPGVAALKSGTQSALICRHSNGEEEELLKVQSFNSDVRNYRLGFFQQGLYYNTCSADGSSVDLMRYDLSSKETTRIGTGALQWISPVENRLVTASDDIINIIPVKDPDAVISVEGNFIGARDNTIYYERAADVQSYVCSSLYACDITAGTERLLYTTEPIFAGGNLMGSSICKLVLDDERIYFSYGSWAGTGLIYQGGNVCSINYDGTDFRVETATDRPGFCISNGKVRLDGPTATATYLLSADREFIQNRDAIYRIDPVTGCETSLFTSEDLASVGLASYGGRTVRTGWADISADRKEAWGLFFCSQLGGPDMHPTYNLVGTTMLHKDLTTGEVRIIYQNSRS